MSLKQYKPKRIAACVLAVTFAVLLLLTPILSNFWRLLTDGDLLAVIGLKTDGAFEIPDESSIFTFYVTEMNTGSGEWWLYAEDYRYFYARIDFDGISYIAFPKSRVAQCPSFQARNPATWCRELSVIHESK